MKGETTIPSDAVERPIAADHDPSAADYVGPERRAQATYSGPDRRRFTWKTLYYGMTKPRRKNVRRTADAPNAYVDFHPTHVLVVATLILIFSLIDGMIAVHLANIGARELNPAIAALMERDAVQFAIAKWLMTATAVVALILAERARVFGRIRGVFFLYGIMIGYGLLVAYSLSVVMMNA